MDEQERKRIRLFLGEDPDKEIHWSEEQKSQFRRFLKEQKEAQEERRREKRAREAGRPETDPTSKSGG